MGFYTNRYCIMSWHTVSPEEQITYNDLTPTILLTTSRTVKNLSAYIIISVSSNKNNLPIV